MAGGLRHTGRVNERIAGGYADEERFGIDGFAAWIGHPGVRSVIEGRREAAETATVLFARHLVDQVQVLRFCSRVFDIGARCPDGAQEPNPFDSTSPGQWPLTLTRRVGADRAVGAFRAVVCFAVSDLVHGGVPLDPGRDEDRVVVAQLLLLPRAGHEIAWDDPAAELAGKLQPPDVSAIFRDARGAIARDGRSQRAATNIEGIRQRIRAEQGRASLRVAYAHGQPRATPKPVVARRDAVRQVLARFPDATVARVRQTYASTGGTPGGYLRTLLTASLGSAPAKPSATTLHDDFRVLGLSRADRGTESG